MLRIAEKLDFQMETRVEVYQSNDNQAQNTFLAIILG